MTTRIERWDAQTGGSWQYVAARDGMEFRFRGCFHEVRPDPIVQTFMFEGRDAWLRSGMETGVDEGYAKLDRMLADDAV
jgi:hypothetical protein